MRRALTLSLALLAAAPAAQAGAQAGERVSTLADQRAVGITIYNAELALVRDRRRLTLPRGTSRLALRDVSAKIQPETALLQSVGAPGRLTVLEQNFDYDLLSPETLLQKYVGREVDVIRTDPRSGARSRERATVLATNGGIVLRYADRIETSVDGRLAFPTLPENLRGLPYYYRSAAAGDLGTRLKIGTYVTFRNQGGALGVPLPKGVVRVYKRDSAGTAQFVGSDTIAHTPKGETVRLHLGDSFDLTATRKQTDYRAVDDRTYESAYQIVLRNAKPSAETVQVVEPIPGDWTILQSSAPYQKSSASTATWSLRVPAGGETTLSYRARTHF